MQRAIFITGTDTGVGKTVLTCLLAAYLRRRGEAVTAFKPLCSGGRADARALRDALAGALTLAVINPWYFRAAVNPALAARREQRSIRLQAVLAHVRSHQSAGAFCLVEGAGGLLSPLGAGFDNRDLLAGLGGRPVLVAINRLGAINQARLAWEALPRAQASRCQVVLMTPRRRDASSAGNPAALRRWLPRVTVLQLPWLGARVDPGAAGRLMAVARVLRQLTGV